MKYLLIFPILAAWMLELAAQPGLHTATVMTTLTQGGTNCASLSVIKLAIVKYPAYGAFQSIDTTADPFKIKLLDGEDLTLSRAELAQMTGRYHFVLTKPWAAHTPDNFAMLRLAVFYYAVMAKQRLKLEHFPDILAASYFTDQDGDVLDELSEDTKTNVQYMGLETRVDAIPVSKDQTDYLTKSDIILTNPRHSALASNGFYDQMGSVWPISKFVNEHSSIWTRFFSHREISWYFQFKD